MIGGLLFLFLAPSLPAAAQSEVYLQLSNQGSAAPLLSLALPPFIAAPPAPKDSALLAHGIWDVARRDLLMSRYFNVLSDGPAFNGSNAEDIEGHWRKLGGSFLAVAEASRSLDQLQITLHLTDLNSGEVILGRFYKEEAADWRVVAHRISDDLVRALTGKLGIAHTKIAFANDQTGHKEIYIVDYDGANVRRLTRDRSIDILPRFTPDGQSLVYTSYKYGNPDLLILSLAPGSRPRPFSTIQGLNVAGGFSPDGGKILMTLSREQNPNIYIKDLSTRRLTRLTDDRGADSSPTFSPDSGQIAFVSDKAGNPEVYLMDLLSGRTRRLTDLNWCDSPSWSPTGQWIAFTGRVAPADPLDILIVDITGTDTRNLTHAEGSSENPSWSPDGRFLVYSRTKPGASSRLFIMDADGSAPHELVSIPGSSITPTWSN